VKNIEWVFILQKNLNLSDESKKVNSYKQQIEALKKDLAETQQRLSQETQKGRI